MDTPKSQVVSANHVESGPKTSTPRRKPHCRSCGSPMLGHKRGLCLMPGKNETPSPRTEAPFKLEPVDLTETFKNLKLEAQDDKKERSSRRRSSAIPQKTETLLSLATGVQDELDALAKPGIMSDNVPEEDEGVAKANVQKWLHDLERTTANDGRKHTCGIPNTFSPPRTTEFSHKKENALRTPRGSLADTAQPLGRMTTDDEREAFFQTLAEKSKKPVACVFTIDMEDIPELAINAKRLKFHARVIAPKYSDGTTG